MGEKVGGVNSDLNVNRWIRGMDSGDLSMGKNENGGL